MEFFFRWRKSILQLIRNLREPQIDKTNLERTAKLEASDFRTHYKGTVTKKDLNVRLDKTLRRNKGEASRH